MIGVAALCAIAASFGIADGHQEVSNSPSTVSFAPVTGFGGYRAKGDVTQISAEWRVPAVSGSTASGVAVTWIGAQGVGGAEPFIQLGSYSDAYRLGTQAPARSYGLFWSDTAKGFHAVGIVRLEHAGDLIKFEMIRNASGWKLAVKNLSIGWTRSLEVHYGTQDTFTYGEWIQEDPATAQITSTDVPYADTSVVSFQHLRVDEHVPHLNFVDAQALSTVTGTYLVPTHIRHDAFSLEPARGSARQFLADAEKLDSSLDLMAVLLLPSNHSSGRYRRSVVAEAAKSYGQFAEQVKVQVWPESDHAVIRRLVRDNTVLQHQLSQWARSNGSISKLRRILAEGPFRSDDKRLRARLGLPPVE